MDDATAFFEQIYTDHYKHLEAMCRTKTNYDESYTDLIDETLQEVFLLAYKNYSSLKDHPNILGWLMITCNHRLLPYLKQQRYRQNRHAFSVDDELSPPIAADTDIAREYEEHEAAQALLEEIITNLSKKERQVFDAYFVNDQSIAQVSKLTGQSKNGVSAMISQIRRKAKKIKKKFSIFSHILHSVLLYIVRGIKMTAIEKKIYTLYQMVQTGNYSKSDFESLCRKVMDLELAKPAQEVDASLVITCSTLLAEIKEKNFLPSRQTQNKRVIKGKIRRIKEEEKRQNTRALPPWGFRVAAIAAGLIIGITLLDALLGNQTLTTRQSKDQQQYIVEATQAIPDTLPVVNAGTTKRDSPMLVTSSFEEIANFLGYAPVVPKWVPEGWMVYSYTATLFDDGHEFMVAYQNPPEEYVLQYGYRTSSDLADLKTEYEQNQAGTKESIGSGLQIYFSYNYQRISAVWLEENVLFDLSGPINKDDAFQIITSAQ